MTTGEFTERATLNSETPPSPAVRRSKWQFSLRMILLAMAAVGVWTADIVNRWTIPQLKQRIDAMRPLARELVIKDPAKIAVVKREELWYDDNEWDIYLPEADFQLSLATREVDQQGLAPPAKTVFLPSGKFSLTFLQEKHEGGWVGSPGTELEFAL